VFRNNAGVVGSQLVGTKAKNAGIVGIGACVGPTGAGNECLGGTADSTFFTNLDFYGSGPTQTSNNTANNQLSASQTIQPDSIQLQYCMRVVD
jgi:hypothetical protein